jgi:hypothetical protein
MDVHPAFRLVGQQVGDTVKLGMGETAGAGTADADPGQSAA